jgi:ATP-binding cassette, subfamily B, multidrug efflux pump
MIKLRRYLYRYWYLVLIGIAAVYFQVQCDLSLPEYMTKIINEGVVAGNRSAIWSNGLTMLGYALISVVLTVIVGYIGAKTASLYARDLRKDIYGAVTGFSLEEINKFQTSSLITRTTNDVQQIQMLVVMLLRFGVSAPITVIGAILKINNTAPAMTVIIAISVLVLIIAISTIFIIAIPKFTKVQEAIDDINLVVRENLTGIRVVRAYSAEGYEEKKFGKANKHLTKLSLFVNRLVNLMPSIMLLTMNGTILAIYWLGAKLISAGELSGGIGTVMAFMSYGM